MMAPLGVLIPSMRAFYRIDAVTISWLFLAFIIGFLCASFNNGLLIIIALMPQLVAPRLLATAIGFLSCLGSAGSALFPWLAGNLVQNLGFWFLPPFALALTAAMGGLWLMLNRQMAQGKQQLERTSAATPNEGNRESAGLTVGELSREHKHD